MSCSFILFVLFVNRMHVLRHHKEMFTLNRLRLLITFLDEDNNYAVNKYY